MKIDRKYKPEVAHSDDMTRYPLQFSHVDVKNAFSDKPMLIQTDGRQLVALPVEASEEEDGKFLNKDIILHGRKATPKKDKGRYGKAINDIEYKFSKDRVVLHDDVSYPAVKSEHMKYPNTDSIIPNGKVEREVCISPSLLKQVSDAMGIKNGEGVVLKLRGELDAIEVRPLVYDAAQNRAVAVVMPMRMP